MNSNTPAWIHNFSLNSAGLQSYPGSSDAALLPRLHRQESCIIELTEWGAAPSNASAYVQPYIPPLDTVAPVLRLLGDGERLLVQSGTAAAAGATGRRLLQDGARLQTRIIVDTVQQVGAQESQHVGGAEALAAPE